MIELTNLTISYGVTASGGHNELLINQTLRLSPGSLTALIGRNGSGKSTLLRVIAGEQKPLAGEVTVAGLNPAKAMPGELAKVVSVVTTETPRVRNLTCRELVALGRSPYTGVFGSLSSQDEEKISQALESVGMTEFASRQVTQISDGEMRRIMIARALAQDTPVMLLDEPTSFLDVPGRYEICRLLTQLAHNHGKTILYSTHEIEPAMQCADQIALIVNRQILLLPPEKMRERLEALMSPSSK